VSYDLNLYFEPSVARSRILRYFVARKRYKVDENNAVYQNLETGVYFFIRLRCTRNLLFQTNTVSAAFEINYQRPSFFGTEAEIELSDFVAAFKPRIEDGQIRGMGNGPYSGDGFLSGWNFGNLFGVRTGLLENPDLNISSMPADKLRLAWAWNYHLADRKWRNHSCFVPIIKFFRIEGRPCTAVVWGDGMPVLLPKVDYALVGRHVSGEIHVGLAPWSEIVEVTERAGFDTMNDPLKLAYFMTPSPIASFVANIAPINVRALERLRMEQILDEELLAAALESIERSPGDVWDVRGL
jgi:hypothetical protein